MEIIDPHLAVGLIQAAGSSAFGPAILDAGRRVADVDEVYGFWEPHGQVPHSFASSSVLEDAEARAQVYAAHFHRHDPVALTRRGTPVGAGLATVLRSNDVALKAYRAQCFDAPALRFKYSFGWHDPGGWFFLNFYTRKSNDTRALDRLATVANLGLAAVIRRMRPRESRDETIERLEGRLAAAFAGLAQRERQVLARTMLGENSARIAAELGISGSSILTFRQRAYRKLGVRSAAAIVPALGLL